MAMSGGPGQMGIPVMGAHPQVGQSSLMGQTGMGQEGQQMQVHQGYLIQHPAAQHMQMIPDDQPWLDNISKAKFLLPNLKESLTVRFIFLKNLKYLTLIVLTNNYGIYL